MYDRHTEAQNEGTVEPQMYAKFYFGLILPVLSHMNLRVLHLQ